MAAVAADNLSAVLVAQVVAQQPAMAVTTVQDQATSALAVLNLQVELEAMVMALMPKTAHL